VRISISSFSFYPSVLLICLPLFAVSVSEIYAQSSDGSKPTKQAIRKKSEKARKKKKPKRHVRFELRSRITTKYTNNLFKVRRAWENQFSIKNEPGQRFEGLAGPEDQVSRVAIDARMKWKLRKKRSFDVFAHVDYNSHLRNPIANYLFLDAGIAYDISKHDHLQLYVDYIPNRFKKNYKVQIPAGKTFNPAYYFEFEAGIRYKRDWNKKWSNVFGYGLATREFEAPFTNRNRTAHRFTMQSNHDLFRKVDISFGAAYTAAFTPSGMEFGVTSDRSFNNLVFKTKLDLDLPKHWDVSAGVKYRIRDYTTNVRADEARYARKNARWSATFEVKKRLWKRGLLVLDALWMLNQTNKDDNEIDPDIAGYRVFSVGAGIQHKI